MTDTPKKSAPWWCSYCNATGRGGWLGLWWHTLRVAFGPAPKRDEHP